MLPRAIARGAVGLAAAATFRLGSARGTGEAEVRSALLLQFERGAREPKWLHARQAREYRAAQPGGGDLPPLRSRLQAGPACRLDR